MMELKKVQGDNIPNTIEYLGANEWAVRWGVEEVNIEDELNSIHGHAYYELKFNQEPTYELFVSALIRTRYTEDEEAALKSNMVEQLVAGSQSETRTNEWKIFQEFRTEAKTIGKQLFNI